jgi:phosphoglycerate kinase
MSILEMKDINLSQQRVIIREDFNVPIEEGRVTSDARLEAARLTLTQAINQKAAVIVLSHLGRPQEGVFDPRFSLKPVAQRLSELYPAIPIHFAADWLSGVTAKPGEIVVCENVRFNKGETHNDMALAKKMASLCDVFVMDAFATAHRAQASTYGIAEFAPIACAGPLLSAELNALTKAFAAPERPLIAIVGGSKVSTKLEVLSTLIKKVDGLVLGGGIANTFLAAKGYFVGASLYEPDLIDAAKRLIDLARQENVTLFLPKDVVVSTSCSPDSVGTLKSVEALEKGEMILDIGPKTMQDIHAALQQARTIIWNGPVGVFELAAFSKGTEALALSVAKSPAYTLAGGGDTLAAIQKYGVQDKIAYLSTGGGAFLEFLENKKLPAVAILEQRAIIDSKKG